MIVYHMKILGVGKINENNKKIEKIYSSSNLGLWDRKCCEISAVLTMRMLLYFWFKFISVILHNSTNSLQ